MRVAIYILILTVVLAFGLTIWLFNKKIEYFDSRLNQAFSIADQVNHNLCENALNMGDIVDLQNRIKSLEIEKQSYMQMHDRESDWFIWYMSGLFAVFGIFGFAIFKYEIHQIGKDYRKYKIEQVHQQNLHNSELKELKKTISIYVSGMFSLAEEVHSDKPWIVFSMAVASARLKASTYNPSVELKEIPKDLSAELNNILGVLNKLIIGSMDLRVFLDSNKEMLPNAINEIYSIGSFPNEKVKIICSQIIAKLQDLQNQTNLV